MVISSSSSSSTKADEEDRVVADVWLPLRDLLAEEDEVAIAEVGEVCILELEVEGTVVLDAYPLEDVLEEEYMSLRMIVLD